MQPVIFIVALVFTVADIVFVVRSQFNALIPMILIISLAKGQKVILPFNTMFDPAILGAIVILFDIVRFSV